MKTVFFNWNNDTSYRGGIHLEVVGWELLKAVGQIFLHPLTYIFFLTAIWLGFRRVKRERMDFHTRVYDFIHEITFPLLVGLAGAGILSAIILTAGIEIPLGMFILIAVLWVLLLPFKQVRWLSMTTVGAIAMLLTFVLPEGGTQYFVINEWLTEINKMNVTGFAWLLAILFVTEAIFHLIQGWKKTTPRLRKSKRGKTVGVHEVNRLWFLPIFLLVPGGALASVGWWPLFPAAEGDSSGLILVPFILTCQVAVQSQLPEQGIKQFGKRMLVVSFIPIIVASVAIVWPFLAPLVAAIILFSKEILYFSYHSMDNSRNSMYGNQAEGLMVLGVLPGSTAEKMEVQVGEVISKVNGYEVDSQRDLYEALQFNPAYCKLEVVNLDGEIRFAQSSRYEGDHHQIGILFIPDDTNINLSPRALRSSVVIHKDREVVKEEVIEDGRSELKLLDEKLPDETIVEDGTSNESDEREELEVAHKDAEKLVVNEESFVSETYEEVATSVEESEDEEIQLFKDKKEAEKLTESLAAEEDGTDQTSDEEEMEFPYGQASNLSAFYEEFSNSKIERNRWKPDVSEEEMKENKKNRDEETPHKK